jgi:hypothetical protein
MTNYCEKCGQSFFSHNDDGSCVEDNDDFNAVIRFCINAGDGPITKSSIMTELTKQNAKDK